MLTLSVDFDGVIHSYSSGWQGFQTISDPPVEGAMEFLRDAVKVFTVAIYSSRSADPVGMVKMREWLMASLIGHFGYNDGMSVYTKLTFPTSKPPAHVTLDDRAITFQGTFPSIEDLKAFKPWNKK